MKWVGGGSKKVDNLCLTAISPPSHSGALDVADGWETGGDDPAPLAPAGLAVVVLEDGPNGVPADKEIAEVSFLFVIKKHHACPEKIA